MTKYWFVFPDPIYCIHSKDMCHTLPAIEVNNA